MKFGQYMWSAVTSHRFARGPLAGIKAPTGRRTPNDGPVLRLDADFQTRMLECFCLLELR